MDNRADQVAGEPCPVRGCQGRSCGLSVSLTDDERVWTPCTRHIWEVVRHFLKTHDRVVVRAPHDVALPAYTPPGAPVTLVNVTARQK